jgi:hypothetical protein
MVSNFVETLVASAAFVRRGWMSNRRFEMYEYRAALMRMRQGDPDREISKE